MRTTAYLLILFLIFSCVYKPETNSIPYGMSHNDYEHEHPLYDALENGIICVEADICLKDNILCVAHTVEEATSAQTLESLYLKPLKELILKNNGSVYPDKKQFYLYIDPKTKGETAVHLYKILDKYKSILASFDHNGYHPGPVKVIGMNWNSMKNQEVRYIFAEGKYHDLSSDLPGSSIFIINGKWSDFFTWIGEGEMPIEQELKLRSMVNKAHKKGRVIRFWGTPDIAGKKREAFWKKMLECGVDFISTDDLEGLRSFHYNTNQSKQIKAFTTKALLQQNTDNLDIEVNGKLRLKQGELSFLSEHETNSMKIQSKLLADNIASISANNIAGNSVHISFGFKNIPDLAEGVGAYLFGDWESWTKPFRFESIADFPEEKVEFALWKYEDGLYGAMIPMVDGNYISMLGRNGNSISAFPKSYISESPESVPFMIVGFDNDPYKLVADIYEQGLKAMGKENNLRKYKDYPEAFEQLTWCTWNAMYEDVSEEKILNGIKTFRDQGITVPTLLIDDGWLEISTDNKLRSFGFDRKKFPKGASPVIKELKENHDVKNVGVWHTMNGYWAGVDPNGSLFKNEKDLLIAYRDKKSVHDSIWSEDIYFSPSPYNDKAFRFYDKWYNYLSEQGISFVKVDQQSVIKRITKGQNESEKNTYTFGKVAQQMESGLQRAVQKNFGGHIINCQDMATEALYNMGSSAIIRNSDDFFPERTAYYSLEVEKGNAAAHVIMNIHNSLWTSQMAWPDFDMFQSHHEDAQYHAILRAVSGGPVYLSDVPGKQNAQIIKKLCLDNGEVLRADQPALPTQDCLFSINNNEPLKVFSTINNTGLLAIWNVDDTDLVEGAWSPSNIEGLEGDQFIAYEHINKTIVNTTKKQMTPVKLHRKEFEYWNIVPLKNECAVIGLLEKYNAPGTVIATVYKPGELMTSIKGSGSLGVIVPTKPEKIFINGKIFDGKWNYKDMLLTMDISDANKAEETNVKIFFSAS